jgi:uncharacterized phage infection (PIP) family protein YhgE
MQEVVDSVKRVTGVIGEIASASQEQTAGIEQINQAIIRMDSTTQQNAALVEEAANAAASLQQQADKLLESVSLFKLTDVQGGEVHFASRPFAVEDDAPDSVPLLPAGVLRLS